MPWGPIQQSFYFNYGQWHGGSSEAAKPKCRPKSFHDCIRSCNTGICRFLRSSYIWFLYVYNSALLLDRTSIDDWQIYKKLRLPTAKIYAYSCNPDNPVGAEYIIEEKISGVPLARVWYSWPKESKLALVAQLVECEKQMMSVCFLKHGCIYYKKDLEDKGITAHALEARMLLPTGPSEVLSSTDEFALGPLNRTILWQNERSTMDLERGPCKLSNGSQVNAKPVG